MGVEPNEFETNPDAQEPRVVRFPSPPFKLSSNPPPLKSLPPLRTLPQFQHQRPRGNSIFLPDGAAANVEALRPWREDHPDRRLYGGVFDVSAVDRFFARRAQRHPARQVFLPGDLHLSRRRAAAAKPSEPLAVVVLGSGGIYLAVSHIASTTVDYGDTQRRFAGDGPYLFALSSAALIFGALVSRRRAHD